MRDRLNIQAEEGFSLAEILVTIVIVGITFTALLGGLMTSITVSGFQRQVATADTVARSAGEWVKDSVQNPYATTCARRPILLVGSLGAERLLRCDHQRRILGRGGSLEWCL